MVYEEQAAFIPGRSISEHCLLAQEILHKFKVSKNKKGLMALKLDMEQAYDSMGWSTLHQVLKWNGFPTLFSNLIMECVVDVRFSIIINGRNSNWICAKSGFRQGCPLYPYIFIMCSQLLSNSLEQMGKDLGIRISPRGPRITHLLYADDVLILSHVSITLAKELKKIVKDSLLHQTLKAKYGDEIMKDDQKKVTSSAWKIMLDGGKNLKNAIRWKQLLTFNGGWNSELLQRAFHSELILLIFQIQIEDVEEDNIELLKWCSGKTISALVYEQMLINRYNFDDVEYFKWLQKPKLSKKVEIFWWRLGKAAIPTNLFLKNHRISLMDSCERGCQVVESYEHIMVHCKYMVEVIMKVPEWGIMIPVFNSLEECLHELKRLSTSNSGIAKLYCSVIYLSWKNINYVKHGKDALSGSLVASNALFVAVSKSSPYLSSWGTNLLRESSNTWCPPPKEWIKINLDASLLSSKSWGYWWGLSRS
ncbi:uncharacterized protein LOC110100615 [Dendrobium catenatum]|uniref:uncharacterized protein LOC110100615 n=1 Tax=Dendrobium catenatum TaxID=906689 RepID=UPI0009F3FC81|nr:uncharacterized protein LOC110100615 [Dendrobium catenatum]